MLASHTAGWTYDEPDEAEELRLFRKRQTALGYRLLSSFGWGHDGAGHITARDPERLDHMWMLRGGVPFAEATIDELVLLSPSGKVVEGNGADGFNVAGYYIHHPIHMARPDVVSACHTHTGYGTPLSALCEPLRMTSQEACVFHDDQAVYFGDNLNVVDLVGGEAIAESLGPNRLALVGNHGLLTASSTVAATVGFFVLAERAAEVQIKAPAGRVVSDDAAAKTKESAGTEEAAWFAFQHLILSRVGDPAVVG